LANRAVLQLRLAVDRRPDPFIVSERVITRPAPEDVADPTEQSMKQQSRKPKLNGEVIRQAKNLY
jgi:hypothetical protein